MSKIIGFRAENFKRLKVVEFTPDGNTVIITGRNAQGKTSVLDAIWATLAGKAGSKGLEQPIREGEKKASVQLTLDDLIVTRTWTAAGTQLAITPRDLSSKLNSPQKVLDGLIGSLSFDPLAFTNARPAEQRDMLIDLIGKRTEIDEIAANRREAYEERTVVNRQAKSARAKVEGLPPVPQGASEPVDLKALITEGQTINEKEILRNEWNAATATIKDLGERLASAEAVRRNLETEAMALPKTREPGDWRQAMDDAYEHNANFEDYQRRQGAIDEAQELEAKSAELTSAVEYFDTQKIQLIAASPMPVPGLSFDDDGVTLNDIPITQASGAERIKLSVGMAMAANPNLRVICIKDASLLDEDSFGMLKAVAEANDFQIWYEQVGSEGGPTGVLLEDGEIA